MIPTSPCYHLRRLHSFIPNSANKFTAPSVTKAIHDLCCAGNLDHARHLFDQMPQKNVVAFSTMIYAYSINGLFSESLHLYTQMHQSPTSRPNSFTLVAILLAIAGKRDSKLGETIHGTAIKTGMEANPFVATALLDSYAKCGSPMSSNKLFKQMDTPSLVTSNAMISAFTHSDMFEEAMMLFKDLRLSGLAPNAATMMSITKSCISYCSIRLSECVHSCVLKFGLDTDVMVMNAVLEMYLSFGDLDTGNDVFGKMAVVDVVGWTSMMGFMLGVGQVDEALDMFRRMQASGIDPDMVAMIRVINACALSGDLRRGRSVHSQLVVCGFVLEIPVLNSLISMYSSCGDLESARMSFNCMVVKSLVSWTAMVSGYVQNGQLTEGLEILSRMRKHEHFDVDSVMLISALSGCSELGDLELCKQFHVYCFKSGVISCRLVENSLLASYGKCGYVDIAQRVFDEMVNHDIVSWNAMISSYGINGQGEAALSLFYDMEKCGEEPDSVTYLNVLNACSHSGLVDDGLIIFQRMVKEKKTEPTGEHCGCVVDMFARAGRLEDARKLASSMPGEVGPNVWKALLGSFHLHGDVQLAEVAAKRIFQMNLSDPSHVVTLSNVYASVGRFEEVETMRSRIGKSGYTKNLGFSMLGDQPCDVG